MFKKILVAGILGLALVGSAWGQRAIVAGETTSGVYTNIYSGTAGDGAGFSANMGVWAPSFVFNGSLWDRVRTPVKFVNLNAVVVSTETTIWTPAAGKKFRLMGLCLSQGVATGAITLKDNTAGTTILIIPQNTVGVAFCTNPMGNGILSTAANNVLTATGVATETLTGFVYGTEE